MSNKKIPINYASRDFQSIKSELVSLARKYYPNNFKDFSEAGFGSMVMDNVAYIGDVLSFYLDYQANESFFDTANEFQNVVKLAKQLGYKFKAFPSSQGILTFYANIPALPDGLFPDPFYMPILKRGSSFSSNNGNIFTLTEDVFFSNPQNPIAVGDVDPLSGAPTSFIIKAFGRVISGNTETITISVGSYQKFLKILVNVQNVSEIISVEDSSGNKYYEVDYLSQDIVYKSVINRSDTNKYAPSLLKPFNVPRRFVVEREGQSVFLQFGTGYDSSGNISDAIVDPSKTIMKLHGKDYFSDEEFDPSNLIESDAFGIVPENTTLTIVARVNSAENVNAGVDTITKVSSLSYEFQDLSQISENAAINVVSSIECTNEEPIIGNVTLPTVEELKKYVINSYGAQNRAVTKQDYEAMCYKMPTIFGSLKRVKATRDPDSFKRNINLHVISEDENGKLINTNTAVKENLKTWINKNRMINDTVDILDAKIVNIGITFQIVTEPNYDRFQALSNSIEELKKEFYIIKDIGEPLFITDIYSALKKAEGVLDVTKVDIINKTGPLYSDYFFEPQRNLSPDGRYVIFPENVIFEIKFPDNDIKGIIV
jgi:hypothetical protein